MDLNATAQSMCSCRFTVGGVNVEVHAECRADVALIPSLLPFRSEPGPFPDLSIQVERVASLRERPGRCFFDSGAVWRLYEGDAEFVFDFQSSTSGPFPYKRLIVDRGFREAVLQLNEESFADQAHPSYPLEYPLDELLIMHRLTQEHAIELHGCGIVRADGVGNLFTGHSGAGKSTTTRLWTERGDVEVLSDDRIIVRRDESPADASGDEASAKKVEILRLRDRSASPSGHSAEEDNLELHGSVRAASKIRMYGTPWHGEAMYASPNSAPIERIFILEHGEGNLLTPLSRSQAVAELFARSFVPFHGHEYVESALSFLEQVADAVPVYRFAFEPDQRAVDTILNLHD